MPGYPEALIEKYRRKGVLIDTNLLVLLAIGVYNPARILTFKRTFKYTIDDFDLLLRIIGFFERKVITPNILTEVDNIARQMPEREHAAVADVISQLLLRFLEVYIPSVQVLGQRPYAERGLTDCVTIACAEETLIVTDDFALSNRLSSSGFDVLNINHIRNIRVS
jgi:hypothetical protein